MLQSDNYYEVLGLDKDWSDTEIKKAYRKLAMEFHPDKNRDKRFSAGNAFKRIREAYDVLSDPKTKKMYDDHGKLKDSYNIFVEENKDVLEENVLEDAFNQLIKGKYPSWKAKREKHEGKNEKLHENTFDDVKSSKLTIDTSKSEVHRSNNVRNVESFRQKIYLDDSWRKITKSEHIVVHVNGQRLKVLTKNIQYPDGTSKFRQKVTPI